MVRSLVHGATAGAVGTAVLNAITYLDMVVRDRPPSDVPAESVERLTDLAGVSVEHDDRGASRKQGMGALLGYLSGFGVGAVYGLVRPRLFPRLPRPVAAAGIAAAATVSTVGPYVALGVSDPRTWGAKGWAADIVPHLAYGWATAATFDALHHRAG